MRAKRADAWLGQVEERTVNLHLKSMYKCVCSQKFVSNVCASLYVLYYHSKSSQETEFTQISLIDRTY